MKSIWQLFSRGINASLTGYENKLKSKLGKVRELSKKLTQKVKKSLQEAIAFIFGKPTNIKDYFHLNEWYVSKRFLAKILVLSALVVVLWCKVGFPFLNGRLWPAVLVVNTAEYHNFTGKCKVYLKDGTLLYRGRMEAGKTNGNGEVFKNGTLIYKGGMKENRYEGSGTLYDKNGYKIYEGNFLDNLYDGNGTKYYKNGNIQFQGEFVQGNYLKGVEYYADGKRKYNGQYDDGVYTGKGILYSNQEDRMLLYAGEFQNGAMQGVGKQYHQGKLRYEGSFSDNVYEGTGRLYQKDSLVYEGNFSNGTYDGEGRLYEKNQLRYRGHFLEGKKNGQGVLYSAVNGKLLYEGTFKDNMFEEQGKLYDETSGRLLYEGGFATSLFHGQGTLFSTSGQKLFEGSFFQGDINYMQFCNASTEEIRAAFGKENTMELLSNQFLLVYDELKVMFVFGYVDAEESPMVSSIRLYGNQRLQGVSTDMTLPEWKESLTDTDSYDEYEFIIGENEAIMTPYLQGDLTIGQSMFCVKYVFDDYFIRAYAPYEKEWISYYEIGGI